MQIYNLKPDDKSHKSSATFQFTVKKGKDQVMQFKKPLNRLKQTGDQVTIGASCRLPLWRRGSTAWK